MTSTFVTSQASIEGTLRTIAFTAAFTLSILLATGKSGQKVFIRILLHISAYLCMLPLRYVILLPPCSLKPLDIEFMKQLHHLVNIIPVIAKSDTLTPTELRKLKLRVRQE